MPGPLQYKTRVRLPPDTLQPEPRVRRRLSFSILGALSYTALAGGAWALGTDQMPVERWLDEAFSASNQVAARNRAQFPDPAPRPIAAAPAAPAALRQTFPPAVLHAAPAFPEPAEAEPEQTEQTPTSTKTESAPPAHSPPPVTHDRTRVAQAAPLGSRSAVTRSDPPSPRSETKLESSAAAQKPQERSAPPPASTTASVGPSCEQAQAAYSEEIVIGKARAPDLPRAALAAVLNGGSVLAGCGVPQSTRVDICTAVQNGRAVGVTVTTAPGSARVSRCVASKVRALRFPSSPHLDVARTRF